MITDENQIALCEQHHDLLHIIMRYGNGAMLQPQLRQFCRILGIYNGRQAINRAVRALKEAKILKTQTWIDNNSNVLIARKFLYRYFALEQDRQSVSSYPKHNTMTPHILQAQKIGRLLDQLETRSGMNVKELDALLQRRNTSLFLKLNELENYFLKRSFFGEESLEFNAQVKKLVESREQRWRMAHHLPPLLVKDSLVPVYTVERLHRRGIFISAINPQRKEIYFNTFDMNSASKVMDYALDTYGWVRSLLPEYKIFFQIFNIDTAQKENLKKALRAPDKAGIPYWLQRTQRETIPGLLKLSVHNSDFIRKWCGGVYFCCDTAKSGT